MAPAAVLAIATVLLGAWAQPFLSLASRAAASLTDPREYIEAVMNAHTDTRQALSRDDGTEVAEMNERMAEPRRGVVR
jgi:multicomponent Na+:H+ antiporter subunit D